MKALVAYGSARGATAEIAERVATILRKAGIDTEVRPAREVRDVTPYDAVLVGGALYAVHWQADARRFVIRHHAPLSTREVYFFSSGPLDDSATRGVIPPTHEVAQLMGYVGARAHATFGGRLAPDAKGFPASAMAKKHAGDHRDWSQIEAWAADVARALEAPRAPHPPKVALPSRALPLGLALFVALTAIAGGIELMVRVRGWNEVPITLLAHAPFSDFFVPGALLLALVGLPAAHAAWRHAWRDPYAPFASMASGATLTLWMIVEMAMLRTIAPLEVFYLAVGIATLVDARVRLRPLLEEWKPRTQEKQG